MSILVNILHLKEHALELTGEASVEELDLVSKDELIRFGCPVTYELEVQKVEQDLVVQGVVSVEVECDCARCLKTFSKSISIEHWLAHLPLSGDDSIPVENDCVDLTPYLREDILLLLPQHPLCSNECQGLPREGGRGAEPPAGKPLGDHEASPWGDLDKLDL